jgi:hypothetical protein
MRSVKTIALGAAVAVCVFGMFAAPAFAKRTKKEVVFGKFTASKFGKTISESEPLTASGHGEVVSEESSGIALAGGALEIKECSRVLKSTGKVDSERSNTFFQTVTFKDCWERRPVADGTESVKLPTFKLSFEFHSNQSGVIGEGEASEVRITADSRVVVPIAKRAACQVTIPEQTIPTKAKTKPEKEYEAAFYETEIEPVAGKKKLKEFPSGFQEKLDIETEFKKVKAWIKPSEHCEFPEGTIDEEPESPGYGYRVFSKGRLDIELEEIEIKGGNVGFETKEEVEEEE